MEAEYDTYAILFICNKMVLWIGFALRDYEYHLCPCASLLVNIFLWLAIAVVIKKSIVALTLGCL